jgi:glutamate-1-semialdehyde 2,1-aminomutase
MALSPLSNSLAEAAASAASRYSAANPRSLEQMNRASCGLPGGNTRVVLHFDPFPLTIARAEGAWVHDVDGHGYRDFINEFTAGVYGHSDPTILAALRDALKDGLGFGGPNRWEAELAEAVCARFPSIDRVRFCNSGTEANLLAVQFARRLTGRARFLAFEGGYHGAVLSYLSSMSDLNVEGAILARFNDLPSVRATLERHGDDIAAVILEPMLGSGGGLPADPEFLAGVRAEASRCGAVLIFDEVQTSRLAPGGLQTEYGVRPDLTTLGKYLGGGLSIGAIGGRAELIDRFDPRRPDRIGHGGTFNNNTLSMVAGLAGLTKVLTLRALNEMNARGKRLRHDLQAAASVRGVPLSVTGIGSIMTLHFQSQAPRRPAEIRTPALWRKLMHLEMLLRGFYVSRRGSLCLSLVTTDDDCGQLVRVLGEVLDEHIDLARALDARGP